MHGQPKTRSALNLPPPFSLVTLREIGDAFAHAQAIAPEAGAGTLVHVGRFDLSEFAVVLEPDEPLASARRAFHVCMVALYDALLVHAPPERPIEIRWPDAIFVDGGLVGGGRLAWPAGTVESSVPDWLVFGASIRLVALRREEAGLRPLATALEQEGFDDVGSGRLVESFARHLMRALDAWRAGELAAVTRQYVDRLVRTAPFQHHGKFIADTLRGYFTGESGIFEQCPPSRFFNAESKADSEPDRS